MVENLGFKNTQEGEFKENLELFIKAKNKWLFVITEMIFLFYINNALTKKQYSI